MQKECLWCGRTFEHRTRVCCDRTCAGKVAQHRRGLNPWRIDEEEYLEKIAGIKPYRDLVKAVQRFQRRRDYPVRTEASIGLKIKRTPGLSRKCEFDNFTRYELARILGLHPERVRCWVRNRGLKSTKVERNQTAIKIDDLKDFLTANPGLVFDVDRDNLAYLLGNELADYCKSAEPDRHGMSKPVRCIETGIVYPSIKQAAKAVYVNDCSLKSSIKRNGTSAGYHWECIENTALERLV